MAEGRLKIFRVTMPHRLCEGRGYNLSPNKRRRIGCPGCHGTGKIHNDFVIRETADEYMANRQDCQLEEL